jgi:branched-chain amino acid transport system permease protein
VSGINVLKNRVLAFAIGAAFAGFAGSLFAHDAAYISANNFSWWGSIYILVWLVIGGQRKMWGPILGAVTMTLIAEFLRMSGIMQALFYSGVLLLVVMAMPQGIVGLVDFIRTKLGRTGTSGDGDTRPADGLSEGSP